MTSTVSRPAGIAMEFGTACCWATLPVLLKLSSGFLAADSIILVRCVSASVYFAVVISILRPKIAASLTSAAPVLLLAASLMVLNLYTYLEGVRRAGASGALFGQIGNPIFVLASAFLLGERLSSRQAIGFFLTFAGLALFYSERQAAAAPGLDTETGAIFAVASGVLWACQSLVMKSKSAVIPPPILNGVAFFGSTLFFLPTGIAGLSSIHEAGQIGVLAALVFVTIAAAVLLARSLSSRPAAEVASVTTMHLLLNLSLVAVLERLGAFGFTVERINAMQFLCAGMILAGVLLAVAKPKEVK